MPETQNTSSLEAIKTEDLLLAARELAGRGLFGPAGYYALEALSRFPGSGEEPREAALLAELRPLLSPDPGYLPGFIQKKVKTAVELALSRAAAGGILPPVAPSPEDWDRLAAALGPAITLARASEKELELAPESFRDLFALRLHLQVWAPAFEEKLREAGHRVWLDSISRVNRNSGYIWLAYRPTPNLRKLETPTYSLIFTPTHLAAGLEFGGKTLKARHAYFRKLLDGELDGNLSLLAHLGLSLIDVSWFSTIRAAVSIEDYLNFPPVREAVNRKAQEGLERLRGENFFSWNLALPSLIRPAAGGPPGGRGLEPLLLEIAGPILELIRRLS